MVHDTQVGIPKKYHGELEACKFDIFSESLSHSDKQIHVFTLRILCHYENLSSENFSSNQPSEKDMMIDDSPNFNRSEQSDNVLHQRIAIEATSLSIATSRKVILLITKIQMNLSAGRICRAYVPLVFDAIIGIYHNQFNYLWNPAMECFAPLGSHYYGLVWEICVKYLDKSVSNLVSHQEHSDKGNGELCENKEATPGI